MKRPESISIYRPFDTIKYLTQMRKGRKEILCCYCLNVQLIALAKTPGLQRKNTMLFHVNKNP